MDGSHKLPCTIEDVIDLLHVEIVRDLGTKIICRCPFCDDRSGHFDADRRKNVFHCYRCGTSGGVLHLYAFYHDVPLRTASEELYRIFDAEEGKAVRKSRMERKVSVPEEFPTASVEERDKTYSNLLSMLQLCRVHRTALQKRGMSEKDMEWFGYKTTPAVRFPRLVQELQARGCTLQGVPGFFMDKQTGEWKLDIRGNGIMLPDRNAEGKIEAIQIRLDKVYQSKFNNLTSTDRYRGTAAHCCPHFVGVERKMKSVIMTEGILKADLAHRFSGMLGSPRGVVGLTGAGMKNQLRRAFAELRRLEIGRILLAYDMDYHTNDAVAKNRQYAIDTGRKEGFEMVPLEWEETYKGIDDLFFSFLRKQQR